MVKVCLKGGKVMGNDLKERNNVLGDYFECFFHKLRKEIAGINRPVDVYLKSEGYAWKIDLNTFDKEKLTIVGRFPREYTKGGVLVANPSVKRKLQLSALDFNDTKIILKVQGYYVEKKVRILPKKIRDCA
jgi:hypothetical protein